MAGREFSRDYKMQKFTWDFAVDGGDVGAIALGNLPDNFIVKDLDIYVETAPVGGGTMTLGNDGGSADPDGYMTDMDSLTIGTINKGVGALIYTAGDTDDFNIPHLVSSSADGVVLTIASAAYTAGKIHFYFWGYNLDE